MSKILMQPRLWSWLRMAMGVVGLAILLSLVDMKEVSGAIRESQWLYILLSGVLLLASTVVKTWRWMMLLRRNKVTITFQRLLGTYLIGSFYSQFLPGSTAGGDAMRMAENLVDTGRAVDSVSSVLIERGVGLVTVIVTASFILIVAPHKGIPPSAILVMHLLSITGVVGLIALRWGWFVEPLILLLGRLKLGRLGEKIARLSGALRGGLGEGKVFFLLVLLSLLANFLSMTSYYLALLAVTDPVPYFSFIVIAALIVSLEAIPLTPGSLGIREGAYVFFLDFLGVSAHTALTVGLVVRLVTWMQAVVGGLVLLGRGFYRSAPQPVPDLTGES